MGTLASKVGENIVGKRLGMSEKDRKLLGTVFGMAGGAYGGYAGSAGFGSSGIGATGASGSAGGMGGSSPKVGGDYGTAMNLFSQPTQYDAMASMTPGMDMYSNASFGTNPHAGFNEFTGGYDVDLMGGQGYASQYDQMAGMPAESYGMDSFRINEYDQMAGMPARSYGMDMYAARPGNEMYSIGRPDNTWVNPNKSIYKGPDWYDNVLVPETRFQGGPSGNVSAQTFALDTPSRTIDLAPAGDPNAIFQNVADVVPSGPTDFHPDLQKGVIYQNNSSNLNMSDGFSTSTGDQVRLIHSNGDGTFTEIGAPSDLSTAQGVEEFINMDQIRIDEMPGGPLDPFGTGPNITTANSRVPSNIGDNYAGDVPFIVDTPPLADINAGTDATGIRGNFDAKTAEKRFIRRGPRLEDLDVATLNTPTARLESFDNKVFASDAATTYSPSQVRTQSQVSLDDPQGTAEGLASEANAVKEVKAQVLQDASDGKFDLGDVLDKIPKAVKEWATMTGVSLLDMWIKQSLFGQDYEDQIAEGGGGGGGVLRGSSPVVSPYSGGGSGGGGKGVLFSMGGSGQQGRGTHIMALQ